MKQNKQTTYVFSLGGIEEIGKNMYIVEHDDEIFIIDCGIKFADENELLGVNAVIANYQYVIDNKEKVKGLIVTHAHEDHIGGIPHLLKMISIPKIYASDLSAALIKRKCKEHHQDILPHEFSLINDDSTIKTKNFSIEFFRVCHSIPLSYGVALTTKNGTVVSTGDFRFDFSVKTEQTDIHKICEISKKGVDILLCETTNAESPGFSLSEKFILDELRRHIVRAYGRVFITTFASNLSRIENIIEIAINAGRKICIIGKAMDANINTSINIGCLKVSKKEFIDSDKLSKYQDNEILVILTGSQGEPTAALNMMANGKHQIISLKPSDTILMSSNPIPGNFLAVENLINKLHKLNLNVVVNSEKTRLHASGHATQVEQQLMIKLVNPKYILPIHGEFKMLSALESTSDFLGVKKENYLQVVNGQKVSLLKHVAEVTDIFVPAEEVYVDGKKINDDSSKLLSSRRVLSQDGIFNVTILINRQKKEIIGLPTLITRGCFYSNTSLPLICKMSHSIKENIEQQMKTLKHQINNFEIRKITENTIDYYIWKNKRKKPLVRVTTFDLD